MRKALNYLNTIRMSFQISKMIKSRKPFKFPNSCKYKYILYM